MLRILYIFYHSYFKDIHFIIFMGVDGFECFMNASSPEMNIIVS